MRTITIVIPCRNEVKHIEECVHSIYASDLPDNIEFSVFIVDGMSDDGTRERINELKKKYASLNLVDNEKQLTPYAFNLGIHAGGKSNFVQIVGARHILSPDYLRVCIETLDQHEDVWCAGGRIVNEYISEQGEIISKAMSTPFGMGIGNFRTLNKSGYTDTVTSPMYPYWVFEKIGFFDEDLIRNQDDDFNFRVHKAGGRVYYLHDISLKYYVRGTYKGLWRQMYQYGYWKVFVNKKHKTVTTLRQLAPMFFVLYLVSLFPALFVGKLFLGAYSIPLILYLILNISFSGKMARNWNEFIQLFNTFLILHLAYGLGYMNGIIEFLLLNRKPSDTQKRLSR